MTADISFFHFTCPEPVRAELEDFLQNSPRVIVEDAMFTLVDDAKALPAYLQKISRRWSHAQFVHTYAFTLANTTGYSVFEGGQVVYQHRENLTQRLARVSLEGMGWDFNEWGLSGKDTKPPAMAQHCDSTKGLLLEFIHWYFDRPLDFDSQAVAHPFQARISAAHVKSLRARHEKNDFKSHDEEVCYLKSVMEFEGSVDALVVESACACLDVQKIATHVRHLSLQDTLKQKFDKVSIIKKI